MSYGAKQIHVHSHVWDDGFRQFPVRFSALDTFHHAQAVYLRFIGCSQLSKACSMHFQFAAAAGTADILRPRKNTHAALE